MHAASVLGNFSGDRCEPDGIEQPYNCPLPPDAPAGMLWQRMLDFLQDPE
jgi:hypothetical protein